MDSTANRLVSATTANGDTTNDWNLRILEIAPTAATVALAAAGAGNVDNGAHLVRVTFTTAAGSTQGGTASSAVTVVDKTTNGKVAISAIPTGSAYVTGRKVWMTAAGGSTYYLLSNGTIANNTATTLTANDSDATLLASTALSSSNTTGNSIIAYDGPTGSITIGLGTGTAIDGSTGAVDNAVLRADGTGGSTLQSSAVIIADTTGVISGTQGVTFTGSSSGTTALVPTAAASGTITLPAATGTVALVGVSLGTILAVLVNNTVLAQATGTVYASPGNDGTALSISTEGNVSWPVTRAGTVRNLYVRTGGTAKTNSPTTTITVRKNAADTTVTLTMTETINTTSSDTTHSFAVVAGDLLTLSFSVSGAAAVSTSIAGVSFQLD